MEFMEVFLPMPNTNFRYNEMLCKIVIHENFRQICLIFRVNVLHDLWPQKTLFLRNFFHKTLPIISKLYDSWQPMGTAKAWQYRHIKLGYALRRYYVTNLARIGANFRNFKLIVGHIN